MTGGFEWIDSPDGHRLRLCMPAELERIVDAQILCRGSLLDGTRGAPSLIRPRIAHLLADDLLVSPWQVHGTAVHQSRPLWALPNRVKADGVFIDSDHSRGTVASLRYGDCTPVLIASSLPRPWVLGLHSGFLGTLQNIVGSGIERISRHFGYAEPGAMHAWIGPAIGSCCYTRRRSDPTSATALTLFGAPFCREEGEYLRIDLPGIVCEQLVRTGIPRTNIRKLDRCTCCRRDYFYSYRGGDPEDRMVLLAKVIGRMPQNHAKQ